MLKEAIQGQLHGPWSQPSLETSEGCPHPQLGVGGEGEEVG